MTHLETLDHEELAQVEGGVFAAYFLAGMAAGYVAHELLCDKH